MQYTTLHYHTTSPFYKPLLGTSLPQIHKSQSNNHTTFKSFHQKHELENGGTIVLHTQEIPSPPIPKLITSTSNPFLKHCVKIRQSTTYRHSHASILVVGSTLIREIHEFQVIKQGRQTDVECLFLLENAEVPEAIGEIPGNRVYVSPLVMKKLAGVQSTESIEAVALMKTPHSFLNLNYSQIKHDCMRWFGIKSAHRILVLEGIQDPGNLGTLLRSALAFKWNGVFLLSGCCDPFNEKALRASRGVPFQLPLVSGDWTHLEALRNEVQGKLLAGHPDNTGDSKQVYKLSQRLADSLTDTAICLVLGSEGTGLSERARQFCELVSIPMAGNYESLNVAVAGGIFMFMLQSQSSN